MARLLPIPSAVLLLLLPLPLLAATIRVPSEEPTTHVGLDAASPCALGGSECEMLMGAHDIGCGISAVEARSWGAIKAMYR